jgi:hypothetical protein
MRIPLQAHFESCTYMGGGFAIGIGKGSLRAVAKLTNQQKAQQRPPLSCQSCLLVIPLSQVCRDSPAKCLPSNFPLRRLPLLLSSKSIFPCHPLRQGNSRAPFRGCHETVPARNPNLRLYPQPIGETPTLLSQPLEAITSLGFTEWTKKGNRQTIG